MIRYAWRLGLLVPLVALLSLGPRPAHAAGTVVVSICDESHLRGAITAAGASEPSIGGIKCPARAGDALRASRVTWPVGTRSSGAPSGKEQI